MSAAQAESSSGMAKFLDIIEKVGNKLPDPALLFLVLMLIAWGVSFFLAGVDFHAVHPKTGEPVMIINMLSGAKLTDFFSTMVTTFTSFAPLGVVLVAMLGVGVAEYSGFINACIKLVLSFTPQVLLTPVLILVALLSHTAADAGYVLVIPLGGVIFYAAGRHPLAGIAAAFAGVSGGFSANLLISAIDLILANFTQSAAQVMDPTITINPACNLFFTASSSVVIIGVGWFLTARVIEPRLAKHTPVDSDAEPPPNLGNLEPAESKGVLFGVLAMLIGLGVLVATFLPADSMWRAGNGELVDHDSPLMKSIVAIIFLAFALPGVIYGYVTKSFKNSRDVVGTMTKSMSTMGYYIVIAFFCALFIKAFGESNIGVLLAVKGAEMLKAWGLPGPLTLSGIILLTATVNLLVGSASAKWGLLGPIFVPMLMALGFSPELTQAAYRVGDSSTNIITPLMPYFPLVVVYCQRYVKSTGIGTLVSLMLPYSISFLILWTLFLLGYWGLGLPLGIAAPYTYPAH